MKEIWKNIKNYKGLYQVSSLGRVKSLERYKRNHSTLQKVEESIKSGRQGKQGYLSVDLYKEGIAQTVRIHRLVAEAFIPNPENKETVNHINGDKADNEVINLEWATFKEQNEHYYENNLKPKKSIDRAVRAMNKASSKKTRCINTGVVYSSASEAGRKLGIHSSSIMRCCRNEGRTAGKDEKGNGLRWEYID